MNMHVIDQCYYGQSCLAGLAPLSRTTEGSTRWFPGQLSLIPDSLLTSNERGRQNRIAVACSEAPNSNRTKLGGTRALHTNCETEYQF